MNFNLKNIESILIKQDPESLIKMGAPSDEYSSEAFMIYNRLSNEWFNEKRPIDHIINKVMCVFIEQFGVGYDSKSSDGEDIIFTSYYKNIIPDRMEDFVKIGKLIYESAEKE